MKLHRQVLNMKLAFKLWIVSDESNKKIFGDGPEELLIKIDKFGSLRQAANSMNMSYSKAWGIIENIEKQLGIKLLDKQIGGVKGGGSTLTPGARKLLEKYFNIKKDVEFYISKLERTILDDDK